MIGQRIKKGLERLRVALHEEFPHVLRHTIRSKARAAGFQDMTALARALGTSESLLYRCSIVEEPSNARFPGELLVPLTVLTNDLSPLAWLICGSLCEALRTGKKDILEQFETLVFYLGVRLDLIVSPRLGRKGKKELNLGDVREIQEVAGRLVANLLRLFGEDDHKSLDECRADVDILLSLLSGLRAGLTKYRQPTLF